MTKRESVAIAIAGSGGAGVMTLGTMLLETAARGGYYGLFTRLSGPQVRGGEAAALVRLSTRPTDCAPDAFDALVAIDWANVDRFASEIPLEPDSLIVADPKGGEAPAAIAASGAHTVTVELARIAKSVPGGRPNMVVLGLLGAAVGLGRDALAAAARDALADKGEAAVQSSVQAIEQGYDAAQPLQDRLALAPAVRSGEHWLLSGNEAVGLGALRGGVRFVAGYPITPSTEVLEWVLPRIMQLGGAAVQAEDELAALGCVLGASYGGTPAMTITSGPGLSLMVETLGLAVAAEIPALVVDVQRGGPSTGIPTKSEQGDLNLAVYGAHGDAPRIVIAPTSISDCIESTQWAVTLAERLQTPVIVLSDQFMGQAQCVIEAPEPLETTGERDSGQRGGPAGAKAAEPEGGAAPAAYKRYRLTEDGVSPMAVPGTPGAAWIAEGLTHAESGTPSSSAPDHIAQMDKRLHKLGSYEYGSRWADIEGEGDRVVITWGSSTGPVREAVARLAAEGMPLRLIAPRLIAPIDAQRYAAALNGARRILVIEQNHSGQLYRYLHAHLETDARLEALHRPGPLPFRSREIHSELRQWMQS
ncbi:MAG: 2-oxoacid:acceptor oxidoreductase subunit alpha [Burkholderiales bacterium]|nr:MAG: 2-oxoacid:acceptor oxidoreductase subunit alpha [Burkholderiales bacterium]